MLSCFNLARFCISSAFRLKLILHLLHGHSVSPALFRYLPFYTLVWFYRGSLSECLFTVRHEPSVISQREVNFFHAIASGNGPFTGALYWKFVSLSSAIFVSLLTPSSLGHSGPGQMRVIPRVAIRALTPRKNFEGIVISEATIVSNRKIDSWQPFPFKVRRFSFTTLIFLKNVTLGLDCLKVMKKCRKIAVGDPNMFWR